MQLSPDSMIPFYSQQELNEKAEAIQAVWVGHDVCIGIHVMLISMCDVLMYVM